MLGKMWLWLAMITVKCYEKPPLTTMALPLHDIGYKACQIIIGILTKEEVELDNGNCFVECIPCIRESVNAVEA
mgnify:CR=1 FL=1